MDKEIIIKACRDKEFYAFGTTRIFEKRAKSLQFFRTWITFLGIVTPVIVGSAVLAFGIETKALPYFLSVAGIVGIFQLVLSTWSIVARWDEKYSYSIEAVKDNTDLYNKFKKLADRQQDDFEKVYLELEQQNSDRELKDIAQNISDKEKRYAYHESLKYYKKECHICGKVPQTSKPSKCDGCGNY